MKERWLPVKGWPLHQISDCGRLRRIAYINVLGKHYKERVIKVKTRLVCLSYQQKYEDINFARLMLLTFIGQAPKDKPLATHWDDDIANNQLSNLAWGSKYSNAMDAIRNGKHFISERQKRQISRTLKGHTVSTETRQKLSIANLGKKQAPNVIEKRAAKTRGQNHWTTRKHYSKASRKKMSESAKRHWNKIDLDRAPDGSNENLG